MDEKFSSNGFDLAGVKGGFARGMEEKIRFSSGYLFRNWESNGK